MFFPDGNILILNEQEQKHCEGLLTASECLESLKSMESNKSPGSDGLPAEFYKVFWNDINQYLLNALNCAYTKGLLSITQRRGLITLIPKKNKPTNLEAYHPAELRLQNSHQIHCKQIKKGPTKDN